MVASNNFSFLNDREPDLYRLAQNAERIVHSHPRVCLRELRTFGETLTERYVAMKGIRDPGNTYFERLKTLQERGLIPRSVSNALHQIRMVGNDAVHNNEGTPEDALQQLKNAQSSAAWFCRTVHGGSVDASAFVVPDPSTAPAEAITEDVQALQQRLDDLETQRAAASAQQNTAPKKNPEVERLQSRVDELESMKRRLARVEASSREKQKRSLERRSRHSSKQKKKGPTWGTRIKSMSAAVVGGVRQFALRIVQRLRRVLAGLAAAVRRVYGWVRRIIRWAIVVSVVSTMLFYLPTLYAWGFGLLPDNTQRHLPLPDAVSETHRSVLSQERRDAIEATVLGLAERVIDATGSLVNDGADALTDQWETSTTDDPQKPSPE